MSSTRFFYHLLLLARSGSHQRSMVQHRISDCAQGSSVQPDFETHTHTHIYMTRSSNVADDFFNHFAQHRQPHEWSFTKVLWACYWNLIEIINTVIIILIIQSSHTFSQVMAESYYDISNIVTWSDHYFLSESNMYFHKIWAMGSYTLCKIGHIGICFAQRVSNT